MGESLARATAVILIASLLSRLLGLLREALIANFYGAQALVDSFVVANILPVTIAGLIGGALTTVFIPLFVEEREKFGETKAWKGARALLGTSLLILFGLLAICYGIAPHFLRLVAPGFDEARFSTALVMNQVMLPSLVFLGLLGLLTGLFQSYQAFTLPAFAGLSYNVCLIAFLIAFRRMPVLALALGNVAGVFAQGLILGVVAYRRWPLGRLAFSFQEPMVRKAWGLMTPILFGSSVAYLNLIVDRMFASFLPEGTVAALNFAARVRDVPIGLFGLAISQAIYPTLSFRAANEEKGQLKDLFSRTLEMLWLIIVPASAGLMVLSRETIAFLFERGAFTSQATRVTGEALFFYSIGIVALASNEIVRRTFYALQDTKTPVKVGVLGLLANVVLNWLLIRPLAHRGLALATSMSSILSFLILTEILRRRLGGIGGRALVRNFAKIACATLVMCAVVLLLRTRADGWWRYLFTVFAGAGVYGLCVLILRPRCVKTLCHLTLAAINTRKDKALDI